MFTKNSTIVFAFFLCACFSDDFIYTHNGGDGGGEIIEESDIITTDNTSAETTTEETNDTSNFETTTDFTEDTTNSKSETSTEDTTNSKSETSTEDTTNSKSETETNETTSECPVLTFNGIDDWVSFPNIPTTIATTIEVWMLMNSTTGDVPHAQIVNTNCGGFHLSPTDITVAIYPDCSGTTEQYWATQSLAVPVGWRHIVVQWSSISNVATVYVDGTKMFDMSLNYMGGVTGTYLGQIAGRSNNSNFADISLARVRISEGERYSTDFIPNTILNTDPNTVIRYNFSEGFEVLKDSSGNENHGIIHNNPTWDDHCI